MTDFYSYLVGGLIATSSPDEESEWLNRLANEGWELVTVSLRKHKGADYIFYYHRRKRMDTRKTHGVTMQANEKS